MGVPDQKDRNARPAQPLPLVKPIQKPARGAGDAGVARSLTPYMQLAGKTDPYRPRSRNYAAPFSFSKPSPGNILVGEQHAGRSTC